jgi:hypothetical protein
MDDISFTSGISKCLSVFSGMFTIDGLCLINKRRDGS